MYTFLLPLYLYLYIYICRQTVKVSIPIIQEVAINIILCFNCIYFNICNIPGTHSFVSVIPSVRNLKHEKQNFSQPFQTLFTHFHLVEHPAKGLNHSGSQFRHELSSFKLIFIFCTLLGVSCC